MSAPIKFVIKRKFAPKPKFSCSDKCECENKQENWNNCSKCKKFNCDFSNSREEGWTYDDDEEVWLCCDCSPESEDEDEEDEEDEEEVQSWVCSSCCGYWHATKAQYDERPCCDNCAKKDNDEEEDDDNESVHSTCCMDCDESFKFGEPVSAEDYHDGKHEMRCPTCRAKPTGNERFMIAFGRAPSDLERSVLRGCEWNWTAKQILASLKATNPDINKTAVNSILYKALTKSLVIKHEHDNAPPTWSIKH
jgi:hypothetical protein